MARRVLSLWLPRFSSDLVLRRRGGVGPLAVVARQGGGEVLACLDTVAVAAGLRRGQPLSEARALVPGLLTRPDDPVGQARALEALRRWAIRYAPWVAADGADGLVIDLTGSAHLRGGEGPLVDEMQARLAAMGFEARIAVAPTRGAAWGLARYGAHPVMLAGGDARAAVAGLPLAALRLSDETCTGLARLGLRQVRDLDRAARGTLARRFGAELMLRLDQALGAVAEPVAAPPDEAPRAVRLTLPEPIGLTADVMAGLERMLERLCATLAAADLGARRLRLELRRADGGQTQAEIALARPMRDPATMAMLFSRAVEGLDAGFGFDAMRLSAPLVEALPPAQLVQGGVAGADDLADLMTRLGNRLGLETLERLLPADSHIPERAFVRAAAAFTEAPGAGAWPDGPGRPLVLFPPEPLFGIQGRTPPQRFRWRRRALTTLRATGPERLLPEWWLDDPAWRTGMRDYWRIDTVEGPRLWMFHTPQTPGWSVQGEFA